MKIIKANLKQIAKLFGLILANSFLIYLITPLIRLGSRFALAQVTAFLSIICLFVLSYFCIKKSKTDFKQAGTILLFGIIVVVGILLTTLFKCISLGVEKFFASKTGLLSVIILIAYYGFLFFLTRIKTNQEKCAEITL